MAIPRFHMVCPPYREPASRTVRNDLDLLSSHSFEPNIKALLVFVPVQQKASTSHTTPYDDGEDGDDDDGDQGRGRLGGLRGISASALEGSRCPRFT